MKKLVLAPANYIWAAGFIIISAFIHYRLRLDWGILFYLIGGIIGLHLLEVLEILLKLTTSPFRTVVGQVIIIILTVFVLTSSSFVLGKGVVLLLNLRILLLQHEEFRSTKSLSSWFYLLNITLNPATYLKFTDVVFALESLVFIAV